MNELTERLTLEQSVVMGGADPTVEELRERTGEMGYVLVKFTETRGGTELGFPLDRAATDLSKANFDDGTGTVHVEGHPILYAASPTSTWRRSGVPAGWRSKKAGGS